MLVSVLRSAMMSGMVARVYGLVQWGDIFCPILSRTLADRYRRGERVKSFNRFNRSSLNQLV